MQKVNVNAHIWNELRSNDRLGFKHVSSIYLDSADEQSEC